jgi:hypothetical protein
MLKLYNRMEQFEYDDNGNIYICDKNNHNIYILNIDSNDDIKLEKIINKIYNDNETVVSPIKKITTKNDLHMKSMAEAINEINENEFEDYNQEQIEELTNTYNNFVINPEYKYYNDEEIELSDEDCYDDDEPNKFVFYGNLNKSKLLYDPAFYESIILDGNQQNSQLYFRTHLYNNQPFYRITFFSNGIINLNIIGTKINTYQINFDNLEIKKIES